MYIFCDSIWMCTILIYFLIGLEKKIFTTAMNLNLIPRWTLVFSNRDAKLGTAALIRSAFWVSLRLSLVIIDLFQILIRKFSASYHSVVFYIALTILRKFSLIPANDFFFINGCWMLSIFIFPALFKIWFMLLYLINIEN